MISWLPALYTVNGDPGDPQPRPAGSQLLQVLSFSSTIHLFTQLCLNQFNWKIINHPDSSWTSLKQNQIEFMFGIRKIPPAVDVIKCKVVSNKNTYFSPKDLLIYLVGHHLEPREVVSSDYCSRDLICRSDLLQKQQNRWACQCPALWILSGWYWHCMAPNYIYSFSFTIIVNFKWVPPSPSLSPPLSPSQ